MAPSAERLERAREIVARHDVCGLDYMIDDPLDPPGHEPVGRYMLVTHTDHSSDSGDGWLEFVGTIDEVKEQVAHLIVSEWGLGGCWDLDSDAYLIPLRLRVEVSIAGSRAATAVQHPSVA